ncbi:hypothetical protein [Rhizobium ruizarguesonis]|uniref:hypothetical protein n=1 Tax=Rhizobium ruizarguesonis TaxID=2081791 RepID=UPI0013EE63A1|nr:hypothetical protein [Rhizobium ruizarguesonis]
MVGSGLFGGGNEKARLSEPDSARLRQEVSAEPRLMGRNEAALYLGIAESAATELQKWRDKPQEWRLMGVNASFYDKVDFIFEHYLCNSHYHYFINNRDEHMVDPHSTATLRISNVVYWACTTASVVIVVCLAGVLFYAYFIDNWVLGPPHWENGIPPFIAALLIFAIGRAVRYIVSGK